MNNCVNVQWKKERGEEIIYKSRLRSIVLGRKGGETKRPGSDRLVAKLRHRAEKVVGSQPRE